MSVTVASNRAEYSPKLSSDGEHSTTADAFTAPSEVIAETDIFALPIGAAAVNFISFTPFLPSKQTMFTALTRTCGRVVVA